MDEKGRSPPPFSPFLSYPELYQKFAGGGGGGEYKKPVAPHERGRDRLFFLSFSLSLCEAIADAADASLGARRVKKSGRKIEKMKGREGKRSKEKEFFFCPVRCVH